MRRFAPIFVLFALMILSGTPLALVQDTTVQPLKSFDAVKLVQEWGARNGTVELTHDGFTTDVTYTGVGDDTLAIPAAANMPRYDMVVDLNGKDVHIHVVYAVDVTWFDGTIYHDDNSNGLVLITGAFWARFVFAHGFLAPGDPGY